MSARERAGDLRVMGWPRGEWLSVLTSGHQIRTGTITWHRSRGVPDEAIATKADSSQSVIRRHYDKPTSDDLLARQVPHLAKLTFDDE